MERALFQKIATPEDLREHHKWARRVGAFYGILLLAVIGFVAGHHYQTGSHAKLAAASVTAINHLQR